MIVLAVIFFVSQLLSGLVVSFYPFIRSWSLATTKTWLNNSMYAQFATALLAYGGIVLLLWLFLRHKKTSFKALGLLKPKFVDIVYAFGGLAVYLPSLFAVVLLVHRLVPRFNLNQPQQIGFSGASGGGQLAVVFISLVLLPPIVEELLFRGFLFTSLRSRMPLVWAGLITSAVFAAPHLLEGGSGGLLWIAALDTFILSLVLVWLREKTGRLSAGMGLHALKNFIAFASLFLLHVH